MSARFSLVTQVVGRAGRRFDTGRAVIQTYSPLHPVILTAARQDYEAFYERNALQPVTPFPARSMRKIYRNV